MQTISSDRVLAVEGKDECNFFRALLKYLSIENVEIFDVGGRDKFNKEFSAFTVMDGYERIKRLGIVRDAEESVAVNAFRSICSTLKKHGIEAPTNPKEVNEGVVSVGVYIMPNNKDIGMLEDLCLTSLKNTEYIACINSYFDCISEKYPEEFEKLNIAKSKILSYLSVRSPITNSLGIASLKNHFDFGNQHFNEIIQFLRKLFN